VLVTRGDVDLDPILQTLPYGEIIVWDNSTRPVDYKAFGRYMGILEASRSVIYFQDDDCIVRCHDQLMADYEDGVLLANMPRAKQLEYPDTALIGWGSLFHRDLPFLAFERYGKFFSTTDNLFLRVSADFVFPLLTPRKVKDYGVEELPYSGAKGRTWRRRSYPRQKRISLSRARSVRDAMTRVG
jgi:hypothetical protein